MKRTFKPNATHLALALVLIGLRPALAAAPSPDAGIGRRGNRAEARPRRMTA